MKQNLVDRVVSYFDPRAGAQRVAARMKMDLATRGYDAARASRTRQGWNTPGTDANSEVLGGLVSVRNACSDLVRNNAHARKIIEEWVSQIVGDGITVIEPDEKYSEEWKRWAESSDCDADGQLDLYGLQSLAVRSMLERGDSLIRFRPRRASDGIAIPFQLQVLEGDFLDHMKNGKVGGNTVIGGVEFSPLGKRVAYWLFQTHPGQQISAWGTSLKSVRIPAEEVIHLYIKERPGQVRGMPLLAAVVNRLKDLDDLDEAVLTRAQMEACIGILIHDAFDADATPLSGTTDESGLPVMSPGMVANVPAGKTVSTLDPKAGAGTGDLARRALQAIGVGAGLSYDLVSGDLTGANYSSLRAGRLSFYRRVSQLQWQIVVPMLLEPIWKRFVYFGALAGKWPMSDEKADWMPPPFPMIDPIKDEAAKLQEMKNGGLTVEQYIASKGFNPRKQVLAIAAFNKFLAENNVSLQGVAANSNGTHIDNSNAKTDDGEE